MAETTKAFGPIAGDYAFFQAHSTEAANDLRAYLSVLPAVPPDRPFRVLDFGCGDGEFSATLYDAATFPPGRLELTLVEPDDGYRTTAAARLARFSGRPVEVSPTLPDGPAGRFDFILSNHVLYYVPDLTGTLAALLDALAPDGVFVTAVAGPENRLIQLWNRGFGLLGTPVPYHTATDVHAALANLGRPNTTRRVQYELTFPDCTENRLKIVRFLMGRYFTDLPTTGPLLAEFDPFAADGTVRMPVAHDQFVIPGGHQLSAR